MATPSFTIDAASADMLNEARDAVQGVANLLLFAMEYPNQIDNAELSVLYHACEDAAGKIRRALGGARAA